jgi:transcriptional regulator with XRE-family HTH domain
LDVEKFIPERMAQLCQKYGFSKYRLAKKTGLSQTAIANILTKGSIPTIPTLWKICDAFGISLAQFFAREEERPDLTEEQRELLKLWDELGSREREILLNFVKSMLK